MSQEELAYLSGLTRKHMSDLELDKSNPTVDSLHKIALALGVKLWELIKEAEENSGEEMEAE
jgi:transcriptional regulator with XRE-family HTH domain